MSSDQPFYAPDRKPTARQPQPGEPLWSISQDGHQLDCKLRDFEPWGVELQIYQDGEFLQARRWPSRALALEEAEDQKASYLRHGYVIVESAATAQPVISEPESDV
jgi:hypothetical protein